MAAANPPPNETERLLALRSSGWLESGSDPRLDDIVQRAASLFGAPIAAVTLLDAELQRFKASVGIGVPYVDRAHSVCQYTILQPDVLVVTNALADPRFRDNPLVLSRLGLRFYAGAPVFGREGLPLGALCVIDTSPREPVGPDRAAALRALATEASAVLSGLAPRRT